MALVVLGAVSEEYNIINTAAKQKFNIQWTRDGNGLVEIGCAFLHNFGKYYSMRGQKNDFDSNINKFIEVLMSVRTDIFVIDKGTFDTGKSPEYFDEHTLRTRYPEFQVLKVELRDFFDRELYHGIPIYIANEKWSELIDDDILQFRSMIAKAQQKAKKYGLRDGVTGMEMIGLQKPPPIAGYLTNKNHTK